MTLQEVLNAIEQFGNNFIQITLTNDRVIRGILQNAYAGSPQDPRGYTEPYFYVLRIDLANNPTEKYNCEEAIEIIQIDWMLKEVSNTLYRYDLRQPPENWDTSFLSCEYDTAEHGHKNKAGLFFFTDSEEIAKDLGKCAATKHPLKEYFLTTTQVEKIKLIDFSNRENIYHMLGLLKDLEIDVLTKDFKTYDSETQKHFGHLKSIFEEAELETNTLRKVKIIQNLKIHSKSNFFDIGLFGQRLTDFDNGIFFKKIVTEKYSDIDGYIWREFNDNRGLTHCLFDSKKLMQKTTKRITID